METRTNKEGKYGMTPKENRSKSKIRAILPGVIVGVFLSVVVVLASGYMLDVTNTDTFCVSCHNMKPFRQAWLMSKHGGENTKGLQAQCVDCHLPHGDFVEFVSAKAYTGTRDVIMNMIIVNEEYDWVGRMEHRREFTYDNACRSCHAELIRKGMRINGILAHRQYLLGDIGKQCVDCHEHVGHKDTITVLNNFYQKDMRLIAVTSE